MPTTTTVSALLAARACAAAMCWVVAGTAEAAMPLATDDTGTQGAGHWQLEFASEYRRDAAAGCRTSELTFPLPAISHGLSESVDVVVGMPLAWTEVREREARSSEVEVGDLGADVKWRFLEGGAVELALKAGAVLPTAKESAGHGSYHALLIASAGAVAGGLHLNVGYVYTADQEGVRRDQWLASVGLQVPVAKALALVGELGAQQSPEPGASEAPVFAQVGAILSSWDSIDLDLGIRRGLTSPETEWAFSGGCTVRW